MVNLTVPHSGYVLTGGQSMNPTITEGCNILGVESWDGNSELKGEIVAYNHEYQNVKSYNIISDIEIEFNWYVHTVVEEYKNYNMSTANHYITEGGQFVYHTDNKTVHDTRNNQPYENAKSLEGEHVIILQGDNNSRIDLEIVPVENVRGVADKNKQINLQSLNNWPCSILQ